MSFKVANVICTFNAKSGGPPGSVSLIAAAVAGHWRSVLLTTDYREPTGDTLLLGQFPGEVLVLPTGAHRTLRGLRMMLRVDDSPRIQLRRAGERPDLVHIHGLWSPMLAAFAAAALRSRIPYVVAPHGMLEPWSLTAHPLRKKIAMSVYQRRMLAGAAAIHATSLMEADHIRRMRFGRAPVHVVPNAVMPPDPGRIQATPMPGSQRVLLFLSRLHEKKGLDLLLRAWNELRPPQWRLQIAGSGEADYRLRLRRYCDENAVPDVEFIGHVEGDERELAFARASLFVLPTYSENFGNVVAEALIRGLPVITTTGTPWSDLVGNGCGWYVAPTLSALKGAIVEATNLNADTLASMGERGRRLAADRFSLDAVRSAALEMYHAALRPAA